MPTCRYKPNPNILYVKMCVIELSTQQINNNKILTYFKRAVIFLVIYFGKNLMISHFEPQLYTNRRNCQSPRTNVIQANNIYKKKHSKHFWTIHPFLSHSATVCLLKTSKSDEQEATIKTMSACLKLTDRFYANEMQFSLDGMKKVRRSEALQTNAEYVFCK